MFYLDPLEQFSMECFSNYFIPLSMKSFNSVSVMVLFVYFLLFFFIYSINSIFLLNKFQKFFISLFYFITTMLKDSISIKKYSFILLFYSTFLFIFLSNIMGMIPYSMTMTSRCHNMNSMFMF